MTFRNYVVIGMIALLMAGVVSANSVWLGTIDEKWENPDNWASGVPSNEEGADPKAVLNQEDAPDCVVSDERTCTDLVIGDGAPAGTLRIVDGGHLTTTGGWMAVGYNAPGRLVVEEGGQYTGMGHLWWGMNGGGEGTIEIQGGKIWCQNALGHKGGTSNQGTYEVYIDHGELNVRYWTGGANDGNPAIGEGSLIDIYNGRFIIRDSRTRVEQMQASADAGQIIGWGGTATVDVIYDEDKNYAVATSQDPMQRSPEWGGFVGNGPTELSWVMPADVIKVDVWFSDDKEKILAGDPSAMVLGESTDTSVVVTTEKDKKYYWAVDTYTGDPNDPAYGLVLDFKAGNVPPIVDAGANVTTWVVDGSAIVQLEGSVNEEATTTWSVVTEPNEGTIIIDDPTKLDTTVTCLETGAYVLQLDANDGEADAEPAQVTINVFNDGCEAAKSLSTYEPLEGDIDDDCDVDQDDLDRLLANWMQCVSLDPVCDPNGDPNTPVCQ